MILLDTRWKARWKSRQDQASAVSGLASSLNIKDVTRKQNTPTGQLKSRRPLFVVNAITAATVSPRSELIIYLLPAYLFNSPYNIGPRQHQAKQADKHAPQGDIASRWRSTTQSTCWTTTTWPLPCSSRSDTSLLASPLHSPSNLTN